MNSLAKLRTQRVQIIVVMAGLGLLLSLLWFRLGSLTYGNAADIEAATKQSAGSWRLILQNPLNAPYSALQWLVARTGHDGITSLRLISTMFAVLAAALFYIVARHWHNVRVALLGSWLFIASAWFLHIGRLGSPEILWLVATLGIVVILTPNRDGRHNRLALPSTLLVLALVMYVPGIVWLVLAAVMVRRKNIKEAWQATPGLGLRIVSLVATAGVLTPLAYGLSRTPLLIRDWLGFGASIPSFSLVAHNLINVPRSILLTSSFDAVHWLGRLPLLSVFEIAMLALGVYFYATHFRAARSRLIAVLAVVGWLLTGIIGLDAISLILPVVYLLITSGIAYIMHVWLKVFPNNPLARTLGISVMLAAVLLTSIYQTRSYFIAWRYNDETVQVFRNKI